MFRGRNALLVVAIAMIVGVVLARATHSATEEETRQYLEATKAMRSGDYATAKQLLEQLLATCSDSDLLLKADDKLTETLKMLEKSSYPDTPGVYALLKSGSLIKMNKEPLGRAQLAKQGASTIQDLLNAPYVNYLLSLSSTEVSADQVKSFVVYNPNVTNPGNVGWAYLEAVASGTRKWVGLSDNAQGKTVYITYSEWSDVTSGGTKFTSDAIVKRQISPGMYEMEFPAAYLPEQSRYFAILDGTGYAYPFALHPSAVAVIYTRYISPGVANQQAVNDIKGAMAATPDDPLLSDALTITLFRMNDFENALKSAQHTVELAQATNNENLATFQTRATQIGAYSVIADVRENYMNDPSKHDAAMSMIDDALSKYPNVAEGPYLKSQILFRRNEYGAACNAAASAYEIAKSANLSIQKDYEKHYDHLKCQQLVEEVKSECPEGTANVGECMDKLKQALKRDDDSPEANYLLSMFYIRADNPKDAEKKAEKAAKEAKKRKEKAACRYYHHFAALKFQRGKVDDAIKAEKEAIKLAEENGVDAAEYVKALAKYESAKG